MCRDGPEPTAWPPARRCPARCRSATDGTCGTCSVRPSGRRSWRTPPAGQGHAVQEGKRAGTTRERWQQVHDLRSKDVGLLDCARRLNLSLNTVKRYDRASEPGRLQRVPKYRPTLVDPYRDYLRKRRAEEPGVPVRQLLREIRERGYQGSSNLLVRYIDQGRLEGDRPHLSPRPAARLLLTRPDRLTGGQRDARPHRSRLLRDDRPRRPGLVIRRSPDPRPGQLEVRCGSGSPPLARPTCLTSTHSPAASTWTSRPLRPRSRCRTTTAGRGVNTKTKMIKRQMYGRAGFALLRHRILLG